jgi:hypothetical protein
MDWEAEMKFPLAVCALLMLCCPALAQNGPPVAFPQVTAMPIPYQSTSGRFSSLNPVRRTDCPNRRVTGRVVSARLIMVGEGFCGGGRSGNVLVNVEFADPAQAREMVVGRQVTISGAFQNAEEERTDEFYANYLIAERAVLVAAGPLTAPSPAFTSYMICQPPELDALAAKLGSELCVQNTLLEHGWAPSLEQAARNTAAPDSFNPNAGDPNAIICRPDQERSDLNLPALACARGSYWAWYESKWRDYLLSTPAPP